MTRRLSEHKQRTLIGKNLRTLRELRGMTQTALGQALGVSFQQIQKYERGDSVISAPRLFTLSHILGFPCEAFFAGLHTDFPPPERVHPAIMTRALKIQKTTDGQERTKLLKIIDLMIA